MTVSAFPFALQNVPIPAEAVREAVSSLVPDPGGVVNFGDLTVTQTGTPSMGVAIGVGRAWIPGTTIANLAGQTYGKQGLYFLLNDAPVTVTIANSDPTNPRIDVVYAAVQDSGYAGASDGAVLGVVTGTPNATPAVPSLPANAIALGQVAVAAGATVITNTNITLPANAMWVQTPTALTLSAGYVPRVNDSGGHTYGTPSVYKYRGRIYMSGALTNTSAVTSVPANGLTTVATLPSWAVPKTGLEFSTFVRTATGFNGDAGLILISGSSVQFMCNTGQTGMGVGVLTVALDGMDWLAPNG